MLNLNYFMCIIFQCSVRGYVCCVPYYAPGMCLQDSEAGQAQWISPPAAGSQGVINPCPSATSSRLTTKMVLVRLEQPPCQ